jgi:putative transposase
MKLSEREWDCPACGEVHDRDVNAARMVLKQGLAILRLERPEIKLADSGILVESSIG